MITDCEIVRELHVLGHRFLHISIIVDYCQAQEILRGQLLWRGSQYPQVGGLVPDLVAKYMV